MRSSTKEAVTHFKCPDHVARALEVAGGTNPFGEPMFRVVWGYDRIVPIHGEWQEFEQYVCTLTIVDKQTGAARRESRPVTRLVRSVIETRDLPKYLPGNCWHLEMWRPAEEYGAPEDWHKLGEEVIQGLTVETSGPYPERGEYELCYPLTSDGSVRGEPIPLVEDVVEQLVNQIRQGREQFNYQQRRAAIAQREAKKEEGLHHRTMDMLKEGLRPFAGEEFVTVVDGKETKAQESPA
jgi:hypothetical protein